MRYWVYKCNASEPGYARDSGDWAYVFDGSGDEVEWGDTNLKGVDEIKRGDTLIAYQTDRNELVGLALVRDIRHSGGSDRLFVAEGETLNVKVRPLKKSYPTVRAIPALQGGDIRTAYAISARDAERLLTAARAVAWARPPRARVSKVQKGELLHAFRELPASMRKEYLRYMKIVARTAALRKRVLGIWGAAGCAACGLEIRDRDGNSECEVAHLHDVHAKGLDLIANAIPLCRTHHWAFDRDLWAIHPTTLVIHVIPGASQHLNIGGRKIKRPSCTGEVEALATKHLKWRWARFKRARAKTSG